MGMQRPDQRSALNSIFWAANSHSENELPALSKSIRVVAPPYEQAEVTIPNSLDDAVIRWIVYAIEVYTLTWPHDRSRRAIRNSLGCAGNGTASKRKLSPSIQVVKSYAGVWPEFCNFTNTDRSPVLGSKLTFDLLVMKTNALSCCWAVRASYEIHGGPPEHKSDNGKQQLARLHTKDGDFITVLATAMLLLITWIYLRGRTMLGWICYAIFSLPMRLDLESLTIRIL
jgi:hypothetical protein